MPSLIDRLREAFQPVDWTLAVGAVLGLVLLFTILPSEHPDRGARGHISRGEAIATARTFASEASGVPLHETGANAEIRRNGPLLDSLQVNYGRRRAIQMVERDSIAAYHWLVKWTEPTEHEEDEEVGEVTLTVHGRPLAYHIDHAVLQQGKAHHAGALQSLLGMEISADSLVADSLIFRRLAFRLDSDYRRSPFVEQLPSGQRIYLDSTDAVALARYHLARSALKGVRDEPDSVRTAGHNGVITATVYFSSTDTDLGKWHAAAVEILPTGSLVRIDSKLVREKIGQDTAAFDGEDAVEALQPLLYAMLSLFIIVLFFRRLTARLVDTRMALRDGIVFGLAAGVTMVMAEFGDLPDNRIVAAIIFVLMILLGSVGAGVLAFFVSGGVSSVARDVWSEKLQSFDLLRKGAVRNVPVGLALLRGTLAGFALIALLGLVLMVLPDARMDVSSSAVFYTQRFPGIPFLLSLAALLFFSFFLTFAAVLLTASLVRRKTGLSFVIVGAVVVLVMGLQISPLDIRPIWMECIVSAAMGLLIGMLFVRFDAATVAIGVLAAMLLWSAVSGIAVPASPEFLDSLLILGAIAGIGILGFVGVASGKTSSDIPSVIPEYIVELAQRERLNREFELAREVQLSFLPARTPDVSGIEIASICLPATEVGGDYYDFFTVDGQQLGIVVGDVSGKGMQAAFYMTLMKGILHAVVGQTTAPSSILARANDLFRMNASRGTFMSMIFGLLDPIEGRLVFARAGHNPAVICRAGSPAPELLKPKGAAIGLAPKRLFEESIEEVTLTLAPGDVLVVYTDGITEAMNVKRELYEEHRLLEVITRCRSTSADELLASIITDVESFTGFAPRHDDMTLLVIRKM